MERAARPGPDRITTKVIIAPARHMPSLLPAPTAVPIGTPPCVVVYEEDRLTRALLREWLSDAGYDVRDDAHCDVRYKGPAHLVIISVYNPKSAGGRCVRDIQDAHPGVPLIGISGQFRQGLSTGGATAETLGVQRVIAKPLQRDELLQAVCAMIGAPA
jgi:DNA-binding NtrC family response regulator